MNNRVRILRTRLCLFGKTQGDQKTEGKQYVLMIKEEMEKVVVDVT